jgi:hypothetical protein
MRPTVFLAVIFFLTSCSPYPKGLHDDCRAYLKEFRAQWKRLPNGFYACDDLRSERKHKIFTNAYLFDQEWVKHHHCLSQLSRKEVKRIFGEPSMVGKGGKRTRTF